MSRKKTSSRESQKPTGKGASTTKRRAAKQSTRAVRKKSDASGAATRRSAIRASRVSTASLRSKIIAGLTLVTIVFAATAIVAQRGRQRANSKGHRAELVQPASAPTAMAASGQMSPEELTSSSLWSKEYIHGPGGKVVATEERSLFTDVAVNSLFYDEIYRIAARGVTRGCNPAPLQFCPDQSVNREQMSAFIMRALGEFNPPTPPSQRFTDVPPDNDFYNFIDRMAVLGITLGCGGGNYCPDQPVNHEQMAAFIDRAIGHPTPPMPPTQTFCDVPPSNQFYNEIEYYANTHQPIIWPGCNGVGLCNPCGTCSANGAVRCFSPNSNVTRRQMAHILVKAFGI